jgi:hypothetical protein
MDPKTQSELALFKFSLIAPIINETVDGPIKSYLDASRLLVHGQFFFEENSASLQSVLKQAILKRGIPKRIFADNGKIFDSLQLRLICASLGIVLSHARPYSPASKGYEKPIVMRSQTLKLNKTMFTGDSGKFSGSVEYLMEEKVMSRVCTIFAIHLPFNN